LVPGVLRDKLTPCVDAADQHLSSMTSDRSSDDHKAELDRHFAWFERKLSPRPAKFVRWLRRPDSRVVRIPVASLLIAGGVFSFLPILGLWMIPVGLVLFAQDVPVLQKPTARMLGWIERKWRERQAKKDAPSKVR
jgi:hypothetical protein